MRITLSMPSILPRAVPTHPPSKKCPFPWKDPVLHPKCGFLGAPESIYYFDWFSGFVGLTVVFNRQTDRQTGTQITLHLRQ